MHQLALLLPVRLLHLWQDQGRSRGLHVIRRCRLPRLCRAAVRVGRDDEMIVSGGENVYPIEAEKTLTAHEDVAEASVIGVGDETFGQRLAAFVGLETGRPATPGLLKHHVRVTLAP